MPRNETTRERGYPLPARDNPLDTDVERLRDAIKAIDEDVGGLRDETKALDENDLRLWALPAAKLTRAEVDGVKAADSLSAKNRAATITDVTAAIPRGIITMWSGIIADIPIGWALCDGEDGRPNLLGRFIRGINNAMAKPGATGGSDSMTLSIENLPRHTHDITGSVAAHNHSISGSVGSHSHSISLSTSTTGSHTHSVYVYRNGGGGGYQVLDWIGSRSQVVHNATVGSAGSHTHSVSGSTSSTTPSFSGSIGSSTPKFTGSASTTGSGKAFDNRPAYYELAFIIKL